MLYSILTALKGFIIGSTMLVPGVSGGTMAMILGIYEDLIKSVSHFFKEVKSSLLFLILFAAGAFAGMFLFSSSILELMDRYPVISSFFFLGAVLGGIPVVIKESGMKKLSIRGAFFIALGALMVFAISLLPPNFLSDVNIASLTGILVLLVAGFFVSVALILPGISVSFVLLVLGIYEEILTAIKNLDFLYLSVLAFGLLIGIITTTKALETAMNKYRQPTFLIILGFVLGSALPLFPGLPQGQMLLICPIAMFAGFTIVQLISRLDS